MANIQISDVDYPDERQAGEEFTVVVTIDNLSMTAPPGFYNPLSKYDGECSNDRGVAGQKVDVTVEVDGADEDTKQVCVPYLGPLSSTMNKGTDTAAFDITINEPGESVIRVGAVAVGQSGEAFEGPLAINITGSSSAENVGRDPGERGAPNPNDPSNKPGSNRTIKWVLDNPVKAGAIGVGSLVVINTVSATATEQVVPGE